MIEWHRLTQCALGLYNIQLDQAPWPAHHSALLSLYSRLGTDISHVLGNSPSKLHAFAFDIAGRFV